LRLVETNDDTTLQGELSIEGIRISWDKDIEWLCKIYGNIVLDQPKNTYGQEFVLRFQGSCC
jgi:hypothetical protein